MANDHDKFTCGCDRCEDDYNSYVANQRRVPVEKIERERKQEVDIQKKVEAYEKKLRKKLES